VNKFFSELQRRNLYKTAVAYAVISWLLIQMATQVFPFWNVPATAVRPLIIGLALGLPILLLGVWLFQGRRERIRRSQEAAVLEANLDSDRKSEMDYLIPLPEVPPELVDACLAGECVLYAGAGVSAQSGLPIWRDQLGEMVDWAIQEKIVDDRTGNSLRAALQGEELESVSEALLDHVGNRLEELQKFLERTLIGGTTPSPLHELLSHLPFTAVLTTNFDLLLEQSFKERNPFVHTPRDTEQLLNALSSRAFFILKLYGDLRSADTVILSAAQYQDAITLNRAFSGFMETLFFSRTLFFVGARLEGIEDYLTGIKFSQTRPRTHYALVDVAAAGPAWELKSNTMRRKYGIQVIPYTASNRHPEVYQFVEELAATVEEARRIKNAAASSDEAISLPLRGALKRLVLDNVGPFDHLELDLNSGWNVFLGDNGVGKSNILKAIAVAICGRDAQAYANRLIKVGGPHGSILLETDRGTVYKTTMSRGSVEAEVVCEPGRPLEAEGWLAVAFPPSRLLTWDRPKSPEVPVERRPNPEDLLPLIKGVADPRIDGLKQWLVNLDYWISTTKGNNENFQPYENLRDEFFNVINKLAPGTKVKYLGIDKFEVKIETNDGAVPLEAISQGTASLMGWVGILLQRLYETPLASIAPLDRYALVLIDEIDAHMHPSWQRSLVETLKELFPNVQFIATTHSPLIVAGLDRSELFTIRREEKFGISRIVAERPQANPKGWYSDMVLTSDLFQLDSTLPPSIAKAVNRYTELAASDYEAMKLKERREMSDLAQLLDIRLPAAQERKHAGEAFELLNSAMDDRLKEVPLEKQKELLMEAKVQLQEIITQSRRP
jgi:putative AbiEii toxin of type IV toxin-antitoxin system/SIR2-like protein